MPAEDPDRRAGDGDAQGVPSTPLNHKRPRRGDSDEEKTPLVPRKRIRPSTPHPHRPAKSLRPAKTVRYFPPEIDRGLILGRTFLSDDPIASSSSSDKSSPTQNPTPSPTKNKESSTPAQDGEVNRNKFVTPKPLPNFLIPTKPTAKARRTFDATAEETESFLEDSPTPRRTRK